MLKDYAARPKLMLYIENEVLSCFEEWEDCFCRYFPDYGIIVTSRAEPAHHGVKIRLSFRSKGHIYHAVRYIHNMMRTQQNEHVAGVAADSGRVPTDAANTEFYVLKRTVSHAALRILKKQPLLAVANDYDNDEECTGSFTSKYGLPCKHYLYRKIYELRTMKDDPNAVYNIPLAVIDQHWWLDPPRARGGTLRMMVTSSGL